MNNLKEFRKSGSPLFWITAAKPSPKDVPATDEPKLFDEKFIKTPPFIFDTIIQFLHK